MDEKGLSGFELSRVELMAQKQNKVAQTLLDHQLSELNRQMAIWRLMYRMEQRSLKFEMGLMKRCTGHCPEARPPTGFLDTRLPKIKEGRNKQESRSHGRRETTPLESMSTRIPPLHDPSHETESPFLDPRGEKSPSSTGSLALPSIRVEVISPIQEMDEELPNPASETQPESTPESAEPDGSHKFFLTQSKRVNGDSGVDGPNSTDEENGATIERDDIKARLDESKRIINMPSVYQTQINKQDIKLRSRVLPPIYLPDPEKADEEAGEEGGTGHGAPPSQTGREGESNSRAEKKKPERKKLDIGTILEKSLKKAVEKRAAENREKRRERANKKLAIEIPVGLYRPDNVKLINKSFRKEDLFNQHKEMLANNTSTRQVPIDKLAGVDKVQAKLKQFMSNSTSF